MLRLDCWFWFGLVSGERYWIRCDSDANTQQNDPVPYGARFVNSAGNLSWVESICYTGYRTCVEVWTSSDVRKTATVNP